MEPSLIERAKAGERAALEQLLEQLAPLVHRFGVRMCRNEADAEDVLQETLLSITDHLKEFEGRASLASWVFMLARTACARRRRGLKNRPHLPEDAAAEHSSDAATPEDAAERARLRAQIESALDALSDEQREVFMLRDMEGLSAAEVAESLGLSVEAVKSRLHRARSSLRAALASELGPDRPAPGPNCPDVLQAFSRKLEGELETADCALMEKHVEGCPACANICSSLQSTLSMCRKQASAEVPAALRARLQRAVRAQLART
ncbi:MAG TPA: sigma-70 family RNA polymerase sigma factor [Polyangiaceae bacterium]|nr:sigma-70 family RNA polymerase sigma factor [Polyangiaceae bacterium]